MPVVRAATTTHYVQLRQELSELGILRPEFSRIAGIELFGLVQILDRGEYLAARGESRG